MHVVKDMLLDDSNDITTQYCIQCCKRYAIFILYKGNGCIHKIHLPRYTAIQPHSDTRV